MIEMMGSCFPYQKWKIVFFLLTILCLGGYGKQARACRTQIGLHFFYSGQFGDGKHGRAKRSQIGLEEKNVVKNATS